LDNSGWNEKSGKSQRTIHGNGEVKREILSVSGVMLEENQAIVKLWIKRREVVQKALLSQPLKQCP